MILKVVGSNPTIYPINALLQNSIFIEKKLIKIFFYDIISFLVFLFSVSLLNLNYVDLYIKFYSWFKQYYAFFFFFKLSQRIYYYKNLKENIFLFGINLITINYKNFFLKNLQNKLYLSNNQIKILNQNIKNELFIKKKYKLIKFSFLYFLKYFKKIFFT